MHAADPRAPFLFDFDATYTAEGWSARIAWRAFAYETEPDEDTEWSGIENPTGRVLAHMVGDDREYAFEPDDLAPRKGARLVAEGRRQRLILFACVVRFGSRARTLAGRLVVLPLQAKELRLGRSDRSRTVTSAPRPPRRHRHASAVAGMLGGAVLIAGAAAAVVEKHHFRSSGRVAATASFKAQPALRLPTKWWQPPRAVSPPAAGAPNHPRAPKHVERRAARTTRRVPARQTILVANTVPTSSPTAAANKPDGAVTVHNDGPAPLRAPLGDKAPGPLKAP